MLLRNCYISSIIFHLILLVGVGFNLSKQLVAPPAETYLQIYAEPGDNDGSNKGAVALQPNLKPPLAKARPVVKAEQVQTQVKLKTKLQSVLDINSSTAKQTVLNETENQPLGKEVLAKPESRGAVDGISNSATVSESKPVNQPGGSPLNANQAGTGSGSGSDSGSGQNTETNLPVADVRPVKTYCPRQNYPPLAHHNNWEGITILLVDVQSNGRVGDVKLQSTSGYTVLDQEAIRTVKRWRFQPATKDGHPVTCQVRIPFVFKLEE